MAQAPAHRFGQIIGDILEAAIRPILQEIASDLGMYLDGKGERLVRGKKRKVAWTDSKGNLHDLDYVIEAGGTAESLGSPRAFVEIAWRRYTKHSRNKAQEIQGAIIPLAERYSDNHPFLGVVLGGEFTDGSLNQLSSHGFTVLYFPYESLIAAFAEVASTRDSMKERRTPSCIAKSRRLKSSRRSNVIRLPLICGNNAKLKWHHSRLRCV